MTEQMKKRYYKDQYLGIIGVIPKHRSGKYTYLPCCTLEYTWIQTNDLHETKEKAERASVAKLG